MSDWVHIHGYMTVSHEIPNNFGKYRKDDSYVREIIGETPDTWIAALLTNARSMWCDDKSIQESQILPYCVEIVWQNYLRDGDLADYKAERELIYFDEADKKKLLFPAGSEGPLDLSVTACLDDGGLYWHIVFNGNLRDRHELKPFIEWWKTINNYLAVINGYFYCSNKVNYWEESIADEYHKEKKKYVIEE